MKLFKKAKKGFTLVELVVVIAVIAILAAVSVGAYFGVTESANNSAADQEAKALHTSIMLVVSNPDNGLSVSDEGNLVGYTAHADNEEKECFKCLIEDVTGLTYEFVTSVPTSVSASTIVVETTGAVSYFTSKGKGRALNLKTGKISEKSLATVSA